MATAAIETNLGDHLYLLAIGYIIAFVSAFAIGANDVANSFATSVGSGVLTLKQACIIATFCEMSGAVLIGFKVLDVNVYKGAERELMIGCVSALSSSSAWLLPATYLRLPVSSTHSIVGATIGFSLVARGLQSLHWDKMGQVVGSWFVTPLMSGGMSAIIFMLIRRFILYALDSLKTGLKVLPIVYGLTMFVIMMGIVFESPELLALHAIIVWQRILLCAISEFFVGVIILRQITIKSMRSDAGPSSRATSTTSDDGRTSGAFSTTESLMSIGLIGETEEISLLFESLQVLTAMFCSFAHGGNDVSSAMGLLVALQWIYTEGTSLQKEETPLWLLFYGGIGISVGLWVWGRRVIETIGTDLTKITTTAGFSIEVGASTIVLLASKLGIPISTTQCKVGSIVLVGLVQTKGKRKTMGANVSGASTAKTADHAEHANKQHKAAIDWGIFRNIMFAWVLTIPVTASLAALMMYLLSAILL